MKSINHIYHAGLLLLGVLLHGFVHAQNPTLITLGSPDSGQKTYAAGGMVTLLPGYKYTGGPSAMRAYIEKHTSYATLFSGAAFDATTVNTALTVGAVEGTHGVSGTGAATYEIDLELPQGTAGMTPTLALSYNSQGGNGPMGMGWNITGFSTITVAQSTWYQDGKTEDVNLDGLDKFALDGNRLYATSGTYGADGAVYTTEAESFRKITSYGWGIGPDWFKVETKEGLTMEYGRTADSRSKSQNSEANISWRVNKIYDTYGNYIEFVYRNENNDPRIDRILYTGNANEGIAPYNVIDFVYETRNDPNIQYVDGSEIQLRYLLSKIRITSDGETFKTYGFSYGDNLYSYLRSVTEYGAGDEQLNATIFKFGEGNNTINNMETGVVSLSYSGIDYDGTGDFNNDGRTDLLARHYYMNDDQKVHTSWEIFVANGLNSFTHYASGGLPTGTFMYFDSHQTDFALSGRSNVFDFYGDGADDLLLYSVNVSLDDDNEELVTLNSFQIIDINGYNNTSTYPVSPSGGGFIKPDRFLHLGDYSGDGRDDIVFLRYGGPDAQNHFGRIITVDNGEEVLPLAGLTYLMSAHKVYPTDFDGDGKQEITVLYDNSCETFEFSKPSSYWTATKIYHSESAGYPNRYHDQVSTGDFNGDGKTDVFVMEGTYTSIGYSDGIAFHEEEFEFQDPYVFYRSFRIADLNGDGKSDVIRSYYQEVDGVNESFVDIFFSYGHGFDKRTYNLGEGTSFASNYLVGDFNGDGKNDMFSKNFSGIFNIRYINRDGQDHLLEKVKNGYGQVLTFNHTWLPKGDNYTSTTSALAFPMNPFQGPLAVVKSTTTPDGVGGTVTTSYAFENARLHRQGKGLLGFLKMTASSTTTGLINTTENELKVAPFPHALLLKKQRVNLLSTNELLSETTYTNTVTYVSGTPRFKNEVTNIVESNPLNTMTTTTAMTYDAFGNVTNIVKNNGPESITTVNVYNTFGTWWIKSRLTSSTSTATRVGQTAYSRTTTFSYNTFGKLYQEVEFPSTAKAKTTTLTYDDFGNTIQKSIAASGLSTVTTASVYDGKGRFAVRTRNALNQYTNIEYSKKWGKPVSVTDPNGLKTEYLYNSFGELTYSKDPTGVYTNVSKSWAITSGAQTPTTPQNTLYTITTQAQSRPPVVVWYDILEREVKERTQNISGQVFTVTGYNNKGQVITETDPFFTGQGTIVHTAKTYDVYGRPATVSNGAATTTYSYNASGGVLDMTLSSPSGTVTKSMDGAGRIVASTDEAGELIFTYYSNGLQRSVSLGGAATLVSNEYDAYARLTKMIDKNAGTTLYEYNAFNQLISQTDANGDQYTMTYDVMGRETTKTGPEGVTTSAYVTSGNGLNKLKRATAANGIYIEYTYDTYGRLLTQTELVDGTPYTTTREYDTYDRVSTLTYPSGYKIRYYYNSMSFLTNVKNDAGTIDLYNSAQQNALGQYTQYTLGNGKTTVMTYDQYGFPTSISATGVQNLTLQFNPATGNLGYRYDAIKQREEQFDYDDNNRLIYSRVNLISPPITFSPIELEYAPNGNILEKTDVGTYVYDANKINAVTSVDNPAGYIPSLQQDIEYAPFDRVESISEGTKVLDFTYGPDLNRVKTVLTSSGSVQKTKYFFGAYEKEITSSGTKEIHYIPTGNGSSAVYVTVNGAGGAYYYLYTDHLGSVVAVTNNTGTVVAEQNFDAWGRRRDAISWGYTGAAPPSATYSWVRGFTGHEHLDDFGLINMNNRLYDPVLARMLSVDNFVQNPLSTQSYNRYSYVMNNPLAFTDPTGEFAWVPVIIGAAIGAYQGYQIAHARGFDFNNWQTYGFMVGGAAIGAVGGAMSSSIAGAGGFMSQTIAAAVSSTFTSTGMAIMSGGTVNVSTSIGFGSIQWGEEVEFDYIGKKGNSTLENFGYLFGALSNVQDIVAGTNGTTIEVWARKEVAGHSEIQGQTLEGDEIRISVGPGYHPDMNNTTDGVKWEAQFIYRWPKGRNVSFIDDADPHVMRPIANVNGKFLKNMTANLDKGTTLLGKGTFKYGIGRGCVNYTSRALLYSGVINVNAFLPITAPLLLNGELFIRQIGIYASPFMNGL